MWLIAQIGFMSEALSTHQKPYTYHWEPNNKYGHIFTGWAYPQKAYVKFGNLFFE